MPRARSAAYKMRPEVARYLAPGVTYDPKRQPLYDVARFTATIAAGTATAFFQQQIGQGVGIGGGTKTFLDTNMALGGQLPANHVFEIWSPRIYIAFDEASSATIPGINQQADIANDIMHGSRVNFNLVGRPKLVCPTWYLPGGAGLVASVQGFQVAAASYQLAVVTNGEPNQMAPQRLDPFPVILPPLQSWTWTITFERAVTFTAAVGGIIIWVLLDGILHEPALA